MIFTQGYNLDLITTTRIIDKKIISITYRGYSKKKKIKVMLNNRILYIENIIFTSERTYINY